MAMSKDENGQAANGRKVVKRAKAVATRRQKIDFKRMGLDPRPYGAAAKKEA